MKAPNLPKTMVKLGRAVELDGDQWAWTWDKADDFCLACDVQGRSLFIFPLVESRKKNPDFDRAMEVQSFLFDSKKWTDKAAVKWLRDHAYIGLQVDETRDFLRYRQADPTRFKKRTFRTKEFDKKRGIKAILAVPARATNPDRSDKLAARKLFKKFNHYGSKNDRLVSVSDASKAVGLANFIIYNSNKFGKKENFIHTFESKPNIYVDNPRNPRVIVLYGKYTKVTSRGIEG